MSFGQNSVFAALALATAIALASSAARAQQAQAAPASATQPASAIGPEFVYDVIAIKPSDPSTQGYSRSSTVADAYTAEGNTLKSLIISAYGLSGDAQLSGAPGWIDSARYDIRAKMDPSIADAIKKLPLDQRTLARQQMLQALLADRFGLKVHRETKEFPIYVLTVAKNSPKLTPTTLPSDNPGTPQPPQSSKDAKPAPAPPRTPPSPGGKKSQTTGGMQGRGVSWSSGDKGGSMTVRGQSMARLAIFLTRMLRRQVVDKTGLTGEYDFTVQWASDDLAAAPAPSPSAGPSPAAAAPAPRGDSDHALISAIQEQLGLKLESTKGPVEIIVIDQISRPSEN